MDENEFLRGIEGERQSGEDLVSGAEHLLRLKKQVGMSRSSGEGLELEKEAGELAESLATPPPHPTCKGCGKTESSCVCRDMKEPKVASLKEILDGARSGLKYQAMGAGAGLKGLKMPGAKSRSAGLLAGMAAPALAVGGAGYLAGKHGKEKEAGSRVLQHHLSTKLASMREKTAGSVLESLKGMNPGMAATTGVGALLGGLGTYLASRPQKDTGKSKAEEELEGKVSANSGKPERGLLNKMHNRTTELEHGFARAFREHPKGAAAIGTATGALSGYGLGRLAGAAVRMRGGK
jgi:hypothetical protein